MAQEPSPLRKLAGVAVVLVLAAGIVNSGRIPSPALARPAQGGSLAGPMASEGMAAAGQLGGVALAGVQAVIAAIDWDAIRATLGSIGTGLGQLLESNTIDHSPAPKKGKKAGKKARHGNRGAISYGDVHVRPAGSGGAEQCAKAAYDAGFRGQSLVTAVAVAMAESHCSFGARCHNCITGATEDSRCAWQVNVNAHPQFRGGAIYRPEVCARAAWKISSGGRDWRPWTTYKRGSYRQFLGVAQRAVR